MDFEKALTLLMTAVNQADWLNDNWHRIPNGVLEDELAAHYRVLRSAERQLRDAITVDQQLSLEP